MGIQILGLFAGALTTLSLIPQLMRVFKLKNAYEISTLFTVMLLVSMFLWITYGIYRGLVPVIIWDTLSVILLVILLYAKLKYGRRA